MSTRSERTISILRAATAVFGVLVVLPVVMCLVLALTAKRPAQRQFGGILLPDVTLPGASERALLKRIRESRIPEERERLITELEETPVEVYSFTGRWIFLYGADALEGWTDEGYDPSRSRLPRDIQILVAADVGFADIANGGLSQFFGNSTGAFAPQMVEWCDRVGRDDLASFLREAMAAMGTPYPIQHDRRRAMVRDEKNVLRPEMTAELKRIEEQHDWLLSSSEFDELTNRWLRETCGIQSLRQSSP